MSWVKFLLNGGVMPFAVGVNSLPMDATVEIEAIIAID